MADDSINDTDSPDLPAGVEDELLKRYFRDFSSIPLLTREGEGDLARRIKAGDKAAYDKLVQSNLRLVVRIAYQLRRRRHGVQLLDLIQDGNLGLMRAAEDFDGDRGCKFSTYASWWIRSFVLRGPYSEPGCMHVPHSMQKKIAKMRKAIRVFAQEHSREPDDLELAEATGFKLEMVRKVRKAALQPVSVHTPVNQDGSKETLGDRIRSAQTAEPSKAMDEVALHGRLKEAASRLTKKELKVIKLRFGLEDGEDRTLQEIGEIFDVTRERIRQIEKQALGKLRDSPLCAQLVDFLG